MAKSPHEQEAGSGFTPRTSIDEVSIDIFRRHPGTLGTFIGMEEDQLLNSESVLEDMGINKASNFYAYLGESVMDVTVLVGFAERLQTSGVQHDERWRLVMVQGQIDAEMGATTPKWWYVHETLVDSSQNKAWTWPLRALSMTGPVKSREDYTTPVRLGVETGETNPTVKLVSNAQHERAFKSLDLHGEEVSMVELYEMYMPLMTAEVFPLQSEPTRVLNPA